MNSVLLIIERKGQILTLLYQDNRLVQVKVHDEKVTEEVGAGSVLHPTEKQVSHINTQKQKGRQVIDVDVEYQSEIVSSQCDIDFKENKEEKTRKESLSLGAIYIGKVKNVVPAIDAAFVEVNKGTMGFLPMKYAKNPIIVNRKYDGRILAGDEILVQVEKEGIKTKDPGLTCNISFTGKYCVLTTGKQGVGFSTKLDNKTKLQWKQKLEDWKIEDILQEEKVGMVVRTNVANLSKEGSISKISNLSKEGSVSNVASLSKEGSTSKIFNLSKEGNASKVFNLSKDDGTSQVTDLSGDSCFIEEFARLLEQKNKVLGEVSYRTCFSCLLRPVEGYLTDIRDTYEDSFDKVITNNSEIYERIREEFPMMANVELYQDSRIPLEKLYSVETRLQEALDEKVWLKSGAYLIIQQTEALTVIDVNSGKIQKKNSKDDIYFEINKEAAREIALQLKLRNLSGIIIIDFISQNKKEQDNELLSYLSGLVKEDSVKTNVIDMTPLGLVEVTRKKKSKSLKEQLRK